MRALITTLLALALAAPAAAGTRAIYDQPEGKGPLTIEIADNGDMRIGPADQTMYGLQIGGAFYLVSTQDGKLKAARIEDIAAAFDKAMPPIFGQLFGAVAKAAPPSALKIEKLGPRTVGGRAGTAYRVTDSSSGGMSAELVASQDPALASVGQAMDRFVEATMVMLRPLFGNDTAGMIADIRSTFALGTPLQSKDGLLLKSVETYAVPPARLALPAKPETVDEIVASIKVAPAQ